MIRLPPGGLITCLRELGRAGHVRTGTTGGDRAPTTVALTCDGRRSTTTRTNTPGDAATAMAQLDQWALIDPAGNGPRLYFQRVPEGKWWEGRISSRRVLWWWKRGDRPDRT